MSSGVCVRQPASERRTVPHIMISHTWFAWHERSAEAESESVCAARTHTHFTLTWLAGRRSRFSQPLTCYFFLHNFFFCAHSIVQRLFGTFGVFFFSLSHSNWPVCVCACVFVDEMYAKFIISDSISLLPPSLPSPLLADATVSTVCNSPFTHTKHMQIFFCVFFSGSTYNSIMIHWNLHVCLLFLWRILNRHHTSPYL